MVRYFIFFFLVLALASCSSPKPKGDHGPERPVDVSQVPDATPKWERRTRAGNKSPYTVLGKTYYLLPDSKDFRQTGTASWYGYKFHGRNTANGEVYDMFAMTAAHKTLPIPSFVRVTNQNNGRSITVRVNDRGPFHGGRVIDLSYAAAKKLGFVDQGTAPVAIEIIETGNPVIAVQTVPAKAQASARMAAPVKVSAQPANKAGSFLQMAAFNNLQAAQKLQTELQQLLSYPVKIQPSQGAKLHRVRIGPIAAGQQQLREIYRQIARLKLGTGFLVKE